MVVSPVGGATRFWDLKVVFLYLCLWLRLFVFGCSFLPYF